MLSLDQTENYMTLIAAWHGIRGDYALEDVGRTIELQNEPCYIGISESTSVNLKRKVGNCA